MTEPLNLPEPLTPSDCNLQGVEALPLDVLWWRNSDFALFSSDAAYRVGIELALASWHQIPAASLPGNDSALAVLAGLGRGDDALIKMRALREEVLSHWLLCSDRRYYHPKIAEKARALWDAQCRTKGKARTKEARAPALTPAERSQRFRLEHRILRAALHDHYGVVVAQGASMSEVRRVLATARAEFAHRCRAEVHRTNEALRNGFLELGFDVSETASETAMQRKRNQMEAGNETLPYVHAEIQSQIQDLFILPCAGVGTSSNSFAKNFADNLAVEESENVEASVALSEQPPVNRGESGMLFSNAHENDSSPIGSPPIDSRRPIGARRKSALACPVKELVELYEKNMPDNPRVRHISDERKRIITKGWQEGTRIQARPFRAYQTQQDGLLAWDEFFRRCNNSDFLAGRIEQENGRPPFEATIDFLMKPSTIVKCLENKYHR